MLVCCGLSKLVLVGLGLGLLTGQSLLIGFAVAGSLTLVGLIAWRRRGAHCSGEPRTARSISADGPVGSLAPSMSAGHSSK